MDQWIRCSTAGLLFPLQLDSGRSSYSCFLQWHEHFAAVFPSWERGDGNRKKNQLWHIQGSYVGYSGAAPLEITHQGEPRRAMELLSFQESVPEMKFKICFLVFNADILLIN